MNKFWKMAIQVGFVVTVVGTNIYDGVMFVYSIRNGQTAFAAMWLVLLIAQTAANTVVFTNAIKNKRLF